MPKAPGSGFPRQSKKWERSLITKKRGAGAKYHDIAAKITTAVPAQFPHRNTYLVIEHANHEIRTPRITINAILHC
jgi:hypothetical protein